MGCLTIDQNICDGSRMNKENLTVSLNILKKAEETELNFGL